MPDNHPNQILKIVLLLIFLCLLLWNLGAGIVPVSLIQDSEASTPTNTQTSDSDLNPTAEPSPTNTFIHTSESAAADSNRPPMPAIFTAGIYAQGELIVR